MRDIFSRLEEFWLQQQSVQHFFTKSTSTEDDNWSRFSSGVVHNVIIKPEFNWDYRINDQLDWGAGAADTKQ